MVDLLEAGVVYLIFGWLLFAGICAVGWIIGKVFNY